MPLTLQFTEVSGLPAEVMASVSDNVAPSWTEVVDAGTVCTEIATSLVIVTLAEAETPALPWLVAVTVAVVDEGRSAGAV
jgi:hypothetical protein